MVQKKKKREVIQSAHVKIQKKTPYQSQWKAERGKTNIYIYIYMFANGLISLPRSLMLSM